VTTTLPHGPQENNPQFTYSRDDVINLCKTDLNFLAAFCLPDVFTHFFPDTHLAVWALLTEAVSKNPDPTKFGLAPDFAMEFLKLALGLPRGHAKTTMLKLFTFYCIVFTDRQFPIIVCAREDLATNFLSDVADILSSHNVTQTFGDWRLALEKDEAHFKKFSFLGRDIILIATGKGSVRGLNVKNRRPDVMIMDDFQKDEDSYSETLADKDLRWMLGTLMKLKDPHRCLYVYIGNMYASKGCILRKLKENKNWISFIVGAILSDGQPIWPELHSLQSLMSEFENDASMGKPEIFFAEVMNDPDSGVNGVIDTNKIPPNPYVDDPVCTGRFVIIDLATDKPGADDVTIGLYGIYGGLDIVCERMLIGAFDPERCIKEALVLAIQNGATVIASEGGGYQATFLFWLHKYLEEFNITGIHCVEITSGGVPKNGRIGQWLKRILPSKRKDGDGYDPPHEFLSALVRNTVIWQISQFKPKRRDNKDDIIDNCAYAHKVMELFGDLIAIPSLSEELHFEQAHVIEFNTPC
jgi:hypothetical protein